MGRLINANEPVAAAAVAAAAGRRSRVTHWLPVTPRAAILLRGKEEEGTRAKGGQGSRAQLGNFRPGSEAEVAESLLSSLLPRLPHRGPSGGLASGVEEEEEGGGPAVGAARVKWRPRRLRPGARRGQGGQRFPAPFPSSLPPPPARSESPPMVRTRRCDSDGGAASPA